MTDTAELPEVAQNELRQRLIDTFSGTTLPPLLPVEKFLYEHFPTDVDFLRAVDIKDRRFRQAAVLIPVVDRADGLTVLLTKRADDMRNHPGQISFPGGVIEPQDVDAEAAALRETHEEIGVLPSELTVLGYMPTLETFTGFSITPVIALVHADFTLVIEPREVAEVFEVPLEFFMQASNRQQGQREWAGREVEYSLFKHSGHTIWGATSGLLSLFTNQLGAKHEGVR